MKNLSFLIILLFFNCGFKNVDNEQLVEWSNSLDNFKSTYELLNKDIELSPINRLHLINISLKVCYILDDRRLYLVNLNTYQNLLINHPELQTACRNMFVP